jgi:hypothetical protein
MEQMKMSWFEKFIYRNHILLYVNWMFALFDDD